MVDRLRGWRRGHTGRDKLNLDARNLARRRPEPEIRGSAGGSSGAALKILVVHGPNLNLLGRRQPDVYGTVTLDEINSRVTRRAQELGVEIECFQSNSEGDIISFLQGAAASSQGIVINPGALGHYSYALHDALLDTGIPSIETHLSNVQAREEWRRRSVIGPAARGTVSGFGWRSYTAALDLLVTTLAEKP